MGVRRSLRSTLFSIQPLRLSVTQHSQHSQLLSAPFSSFQLLSAPFGSSQLLPPPSSVQLRWFLCHWTGSLCPESTSTVQHAGLRLGITDPRRDSTAGSCDSTAAQVVPGSGSSLAGPVGRQIVGCSVRRCVVKSADSLCRVVQPVDVIPHVGALVWPRHHPVTDANHRW